MARGEKTTAKTLVEEAYIKIKQDIITGLLEPGEKININQLIAKYEISVTPIKQALNRLIAEGLVESTPHKGVKTKKVAWPEIEEILEIRLMMETYFVKKVIASVRSSSVVQEKFRQNIQAHYEFVEKYSEVSEYLKVYQLDEEFHELYLRCSGNKKLISMYHFLNSHSYAVYLYGKQPREKTLMGVQEHERIYKALLAQDEEKAKEEIINHNQNAKEIIYLMLKIANNF